MIAQENKYELLEDGSRLHHCPMANRYALSMTRQCAEWFSQILQGHRPNNCVEYNSTSHFLNEEN